MKKTIAVVMMVILTMSLVMAQAEGADVKAWRIGLDDEGGNLYYVTYQTSTGVPHEFQVSEAEFNLAVEELAKIKNEEAKEAEKEAKKSQKKTWLGNVKSTITFWNQND